MALHNFFGSKWFFHVVFSSAMLDWMYEACLPQNCGSGPNITYPCWILDSETEKFGDHPGFEGLVSNISLSIGPLQVITSSKTSFIQTSSKFQILGLGRPGLVSSPGVRLVIGTG